jgi:DNA-directed RNA polymerase specialized sigma24 family protein
MATKVMTSIYLTSAQKRALARRARQHQTTVSEEIRTAVEKHFKDEDAEAEQQLVLLSAEANKAMDRMIQKLDEAHASIVHLRKSMGRRKS